MEIWRVICNGCQVILEEGTGYWEVDSPRPQSPCPQCGSLDQGLMSTWEDNPTEQQRQMVPGTRRARARAADDEDEEEPSFRFLLRYDSGAFSRLVWQQESERLPGAGDIRYREARAEKLGQAYKEALERELEAATPGTKWRAPATNPEGGRGPGGDAVELIKPIFDAAATIAQFLQVVWALNEGQKLLKKLGNGREPLPNEDSAIPKAAEAVYERTALTNLSFAFTTTILSSNAGHHAPVEGFAVGFRGPETLWVVALDLYGEVLGVTSLPIADNLPHRWDD